MFTTAHINENISSSHCKTSGRQPESVAPIRPGACRPAQARHVLAHQDGLVDGDYVAKSGDRRYAEGQRLVVAPDDVRRFADIVETLSAAITVALTDEEDSS